MTKTSVSPAPPDQQQRNQALDPTRSILVQAPAGSGKTTLLTERFLTLLAEVDEPGQVVAITFTNAAAAEMRNRILDELRSPEPTEIAQRVLERSNAHGWKLFDLPAQLRISTIDAFCRELALQQPLLSGFGGGLNVAEQPEDLYRRAARHTLEQIGNRDNRALSDAVEALLVWRDNNWQELENLLVEMLSKRDRWMHEFVLSRDPDWDALRRRLEQPFANAVRETLAEASRLLDQVPGAREEALLLARFACTQPGGEQHRPLAELAEFPIAPFQILEALEEAHQAHNALVKLTMTQSGTFRKTVDKNHGFPSDRKTEKDRLLRLNADLRAVPDLERALVQVSELPPCRYPDEDWAIIRACFTLLRHAAAQLKVVFAEAAAVDFIEVAQIAASVLKGDGGFPSDAALAVADGIRHLLVDEFQDTSRRQHQLLAGLIAAWPDQGSARTARTCFLVGDPMQSIYFFRDADAELFARVKEIGLEIPSAEPLHLDFVPLSANFRTAPDLVGRLNEIFERVFAEDDGSGVTFAKAEAARESDASDAPRFDLHLSFTPQPSHAKTLEADEALDQDDTQTAQVAEIVELIQSRTAAMEEARASGGKYRIAVLARARKSLGPIAEALHRAAIPFRAVDLEKLAARPEVLDALALARALLNPHDRVAWLGVLRAPWCGLSLSDLHALTSTDDQALLARPIPQLLSERISLLSKAGQSAAQRVLAAFDAAPAIRSAQPTASLGTWLQQVWLTLGGADCSDANARANLDLLWRCLDKLPDGEPDLLGPPLNAALSKLTALPDPAASSDFGVQLMTIHKSKGLEFEVVIVPDLQAKTAASSKKLLSWLERGLAPDASADFDDEDQAAAITEFLIAPLQSRGNDPGKPKKWVDRVYRDRETQEIRRILYVAATRAREELHLFARPSYKADANGELSLVNPSPGLLSTAWPALQEEIQARFEAWKAARKAESAASKSGQEIDSLAASAEANLLVMPPPAPSPTMILRLPEDYAPVHSPALNAPSVASAASEFGASALYARHEGGLLSRALGTAVHALLEELARLCASIDMHAARATLTQFEPRIAAQIRSTGIAASQAARIAAQALEITLAASHDSTGEWILSPHPGAASEVEWTGVLRGSLSNVRVDRVFRAGLTPLSEGDAAWWIIDYKTAQSDPAALPQLRSLFKAQLEAYAQVLRNLHGQDAVVRAGLYYPRMLLFDWFEP